MIGSKKKVASEISPRAPQARLTHRARGEEERKRRGIFKARYFQSFTTVLFVGFYCIVVSFYITTL